MARLGRSQGLTNGVRLGTLGGQVSRLEHDGPDANSTNITTAQWLAEPFTPGQTFTAASLWAVVGGANTSDATLTIRANNNGKPGTILATATITGITGSPVMSQSSAISQVLQAGVTYWLVFQSTGTTTLRTNTSGGPFGWERASLTTNSGTTWADAGGVWLSYRVDGASASGPPDFSVVGPWPPGPSVNELPFYPTVLTIGVNLAADLLRRRFFSTLRFPKQWYEGSETDIGSPRSSAASIIVYPERALGPDPPTILAAPPTQQQQTIGVVTAGAQSRRLTEKRRFPFQGWEQQAALETGTTVAIQTLTSADPNASVGGIIFGGSGTAEQRAQKFQDLSGQVLTATVYMDKTGTPTDNVVLEVQTDSGGQPSGTALATSNPVPGSTLSTSPTVISFTFPSSPNITAPAWLVIRRDGARDTSNFYEVKGPSFASAEGPNALRASGTWTVQTGQAYSATITYQASIPSSCVYQMRFLGPRPPLLILPLPSQQQQRIVRALGLSQAVVEREQAQKREPKSLLFPPATLAQPPPLAEIAVTNTAVAQRRLPTRPTAYGIGPPLLTVQNPTYQQATVAVTLVAVATRASLPRRCPILDQDWEPVYGGNGAPTQTPLDNFNRADANPISGNWTGALPGGTQPLQIVSNAATGAAGTTSTGTYRAAQPANQQAVVTVATVPASGNLAAIILRSTGGGSYYYGGYQLGLGWQFASVDNAGAVTQIGAVITGNDLNAGDKIGFTAFGNALTLWRYDKTNGVWILIGSRNDTTLTGTGSAGLRVRTSTGVFEDFGVGSFSNPIVGALRQPFIGVKPPMVLLPLPTETTVQVTNTAVEQRRLPTRPTSGGVAPPLVVNPLPSQTQETVKTWTVGRVTRRPPQSRLQPPTVVTTAAQTFPAFTAPLARTRPRKTFSSLPVVIGAASTFIASPITTILVVPDRIERRHFNSFLAPPTVLQTFAGPQITLVHTRPRRFAAKYVVPATLEPEAVAIAEREIRTVLVRTRPRHTVGTRLSYTVYPATSRIAVTLVRTRPRPTHVAQRGLIFYAVADTTILVQNVRTRPRPTTKFVKPPATLQPYAVTVAEDTVRVTLARIRPRPTAKRLAPPTVLQVFTGPATTLVKTRPRPTTRRLSPPIFYAQTTAITVTLVHTRPRPTRHTLGPLIFYAVAETPNIAWTVRTRPRPTTKFLAPPATLTAAAVAFYAGKPTLVQTRPRSTHIIRHGLAFYAATSEISVTLARTRPRPTAKRLTAVTYPATSEIQVALVRTRPRPTRHALTAVTYAQAGVGFTHLVRTRPRHAVAFVAPPATLEPESVALAERQIHAPLIHTRPRRTISRLTAVTYPATSEIQVTLVRIRPRPTAHRLTAITYAATSEIQVTLTRTRPRPTTKFLLPPATLQPYAVTIAEDTVRVTLVHTRPRHTLGTNLAEPTTLQTFGGPDVTLVHTRPRPTVKRVLPPTVIRVPSVEQREDTITVRLVQTRPRPTAKFIREPIVKTFPPVVTTFLPAHLVQTRPRPTRKFLRPPTVVIPLPTQRMQTLTVWLDAVRTRREWTRRFPLMGFTGAQESRTPAGTTTEYDKFRRGDWNYLIGPRRPMVLLPVPTQREQTVKVFRTRIRPRHTLGTKLGPPTTLQVFGPPVEVEIAVRTPVDDRAHRQTRHFFIQPVTYAATSEISVALVRTRPRPTTRALREPTVLQTFQAAATTLVTTRPRPTRHFIAPPTTLQTFGPPVEVEIAVRTPLDDRAHRQTRSFPIRPLTFPATSEITVALVRTRPRPTSKHLAPPTIVVGIAFYGPTVHTVHTRPRPTTRFVAPPTVVTRPPAVLYPIFVTLVHTRPRPTRAFKVELHVPPRVPPKPGFTTGIDVAATGASDTDVGASTGASSSIVADYGADSSVVSTGGATSDVLADEGDIHDQPGGLT